MDRRSWVALLLLGAIWGASYLFIKISLREFDPWLVSWGRVALALGVLIPVAWYAGALRGIRENLSMIALCGVIQVAGPFVLIAVGEQEISSALAGILVATTPIFAALLAFRWDREEAAEGSRLAGIGLGLAGVVLLFGVDLGGSSDELVGGALVVVASLGYAIGGFLVKHRVHGVAPLGVATGVIASATLLLMPFAVATAPTDAPDLGPVAALLALGLLGTGVAFAIFYWLIDRVGPSRTFVVTYLAPGFAVVYGATLLDEAIGLATVIGLGAVLGGSWLAAGGAKVPPEAGEPPEPADPAPAP